MHTNLSHSARPLLCAALPLLLLAAPAPADGTSCNTGTLQCCEQTQSANSTAIAPILRSIGVVLQDVNALVGLSCSPITAVGVGSGNAW